MIIIQNRYEHRELSGASTWVVMDDVPSGEMTFDTLSVEGHAHLAFIPNPYTSNVKVDVGLFEGDKTGINKGLMLAE